MTEKPGYYDTRSELWRRHFKQGQGYEEYLSYEDPTYAERWRQNEAALPPLTTEQVARLSAHNRCLKVLVYSGAWCGDCVRQGPMIQKIAEAVGGAVEVRFIDREESQALKDELRILGAMRVPVAVFLSEDFHEVARVGDRMLAAYRRKLREETGGACETGIIPRPDDELRAEQDEWVDHFERVLIMLRLSPPLRARHND